MRNINNEMRTAGLQQGYYSKLAAQSNQIMDKLHQEYTALNIPNLNLHDNRLEYNFWGLEFVVFAETKFNNDAGGFAEGELRTYLKDGDNLTEILSYSFDAIGNINRFHSIDGFSKPYYLDFMSTILQRSANGELRFILE